MLDCHRGPLEAAGRAVGRATVVAGMTAWFGVRVAVGAVLRPLSGGPVLPPGRYTALAFARAVEPRKGRGEGITFGSRETASEVATEGRE